MKMRQIAVEYMLLKVYPREPRLSLGNFICLILKWDKWSCASLSIFIYSYWSVREIKNKLVLFWDSIDELINSFYLTKVSPN